MKYINGQNPQNKLMMITVSNRNIAFNLRSLQNFAREALREFNYSVCEGKKINEAAKEETIFFRI